MKRNLDIKGEWRRGICEQYLDVNFEWPRGCCGATI